MTKLVRLIFRLDFKDICTSLMNEPGTAFGILESSGEDFWQDYSENVQSRTMQASYHDRYVLYRNLSIDNKSISGSIEFLSGGIDLSRILSDKTFIEMDRLVSEFIQKLSISSLRRAGIRLFVVDTMHAAEGQAFRQFNKIFSKNIISDIQKKLGELKDTSALFEGTGEDDISYNVRFGPLFEHDTSKVLFGKGEIEDPAFLVNQGFNFLADLDLYENDISFREFTLRKWARTKVEKSASFVDALKVRVPTLEG